MQKIGTGATRFLSQPSGGRGGLPAITWFLTGERRAVGANARGVAGLAEARTNRYGPNSFTSSASSFSPWVSVVTRRPVRSRRNVAGMLRMLYCLPNG